MEKLLFAQVRTAFLFLLTLCGFECLSLAYVPVPGVRADESSGISIECGLAVREVPSSGYCPVHFKIGNRTSEAHSWQLAFQIGGSGARQHKSGYNTALSVGAGETREWDVLVPLATMERRDNWYQPVLVTMTGYGVANGRFVLPNRSVSYQRTSYTAISDTLASSAWSKIETSLKKATAARHDTPELNARRNPYGTSSSGRQLVGSEVTLNELPPDWRAFAGFGSLWVSSSDWEGLSPDRCRAVRQWIAAGGRLFVASSNDVIERLPQLPGPLEVGKSAAVGFGRVQAVKLQNNELEPDDTAQQILTLDSAPLPAWQEDYESSWKLASSLGWPTLNVPLVVGFVALFAVVIGPMNLRWFAPRKQRSRLFLTVPLLSAGASVLLFGVIAIGDGFGGTGGRNVFLYLPAGENYVTLLQEQVGRTRLLFSRSFKVPESVQIGYAQQSQQSDGGLSLEREGEIVSGDWFRSRSVHTHVLRANIPSRAEVVLQNTGTSSEQPTLLSTAATTMRDVHYIDATGRYWKTDKIETGRPAKLQPSTKEALDEWVERESEMLSPNLKANLKHVVHRLGHFYASAESMPEGPIETLASMSWNRPTVLCFGTCTGGATK